MTQSYKELPARRPVGVRVAEASIGEHVTSDRLDIRFSQSPTGPERALRQQQMQTKGAPLKL